MATMPDVQPSTMRHGVLFHPSDQGIFANVWLMERDGGAHAHDFVELAIIASGRARHISAQGSTLAVPGRVFVLRPGSWHWYVDCDRFVVANCCLTIEALSTSLAFLRFIPSVERLLWRGPMAPGRHGVLELEIDSQDAILAAQAVERLAGALAGNVGGKVSRAASVLQVLGHLLDHGVALDRTVDLPVKVRTVLTLLEDAPEHDWTLEQLASRVDLAPTYLVRLVKEHIGAPPLGYLARLRAERAAVLLSTTPLTVGQVGGLVGWPDPSYFARRFRQLTGLSPTAYRDRAREGRLNGPDAPR